MQSLKMYFGRDIPGGGFVDDAAWAGFVSRVLTPAFPDGFTVLSGRGQWRNPKTGAVGGEASFEVEVVGVIVPARVAGVVGAYKREFRQEAVGVVTGEVCGV